MAWYNDNMIDSRNSSTLQRSKDYQDLVDSTLNVLGQDFNPIVVDNIFDLNEMKHIYNVVRSTPIENLKVADWGGQASWQSTNFGPLIENKLVEIGKSFFGDELYFMHDYSFVRYSEEFGYKSKLFPHADKREKPRMLLDIQLKADEEWPIVVEETSYFLKDNQALIFSGTGQIHWREKKDLSTHSRIDMMFVNFEYTDNRPFQDGQYTEAILPRSKYLRQKYNIDDTPIKIDRKFNAL
jgi:hypothetical protein